MMRRLPAYRIIAIVLGVFLYSHAAEAVQDPAPSAKTLTPVPVGGDSGTWRRDPFIGSLKKSGGAPTAKGVTPKSATGLPKQSLEQENNIQLQGIMQTDKRFHALINGRSVKAGDAIGGVTVKQITRYQVVLVNERKETIIYDIYQGRIDRGKQ